MNNYFISGTSSGIGKAIVEELLTNKDTNIVGFSRSNTLNYPNFKHVSVDLTELQDLDKIIFPKMEGKEKIVLINNAGMLGEIKHVGQQSNQNIINSMQVNFTSAAVLMNMFIESYQDLNCEKIIINITSGAASSPYDGWANYCSAKAALNMYTEVIDKEQQLKKFPIKTFAIAPGVVDTGMQDEIRSSSAEQFTKIDKFIDLKNNEQLYSPQDVAKKLIAMINNTQVIPNVISRINL